MGKNSHGGRREHDHRSAAKDDERSGVPPCPREVPRDWKIDLASFTMLIPTWLWFMKVWFWHSSDGAKVLPGATGFGWFFRYLTFFGFTLQTLQLTVSVAAAFTVNRRNMASGHGKWLRDFADAFSCAVFPFANTVTIMYYTVHFLTGRDGAVEGGEIERPPWLGMTVHYGNCVAAWVHMLLAQHSFSTTAERTSIMFAAAYFCYIVVCSHYNGQFPYPFLNKLPFPWGFLGVATVSILVFVAIFRVGKGIKSLIGGSSNADKLK